jgi:flagellar motor switch protein FliM
MKEILTNEEIDTLLDMFRADDPALEEVASELGGRAPTDKVATTVDLLKPNRVSREQMRGFERIFRSAAKSLAATISDKLRLDMLCDCVAVEQIRFQSWGSLLSSPAAVYVVELAPLGTALFTVTTNLLYGAVDRILGGSGRVRGVTKEFTAAEYTVADAFVAPCLERICASLADNVELDWSIKQRYSSPSMAQIVPGQEVVLSVHFQVGGEVLLGDLRLAIPHAALEPHLGQLRAGAEVRGQQPGDLRKALASTLQPVPLDLAVELGEGSLPLRQLLALAVGDVVPLRRRVGEPLLAPIQGVPKFAGNVGTVGNRLAFRVGSLLPVAGGGTR